MSDGQRMVIVGAGQAGASAAETLRAEGWPGEIVLIGSEQELPYQRPPLSKGVLLGAEDLETARLLDHQWYDDNRIDLRLGTTATSLDPAARTVTLSEGGALGYHRLLLATGSRVRTLDLPGADLAGIHYLRTAPDSLALLGGLRRRPRVVVVGAGWIGLEVAAAARGHECEVTVVEPRSTALAGVLGEQIGELFADLHRRHEVDFRFGSGVIGFEGDNSVTGVRTDGGETLPADLVVVGAGVRPNVELAGSAGLELAGDEDGGGVVTGPDLRTSAPEVFAAGDLARWHHPVFGRPVRVEHWANAKDGGVAAAKAMLGQAVAYDAIPYFFTDQYDLGMEYAGDVPRGTSYHLVLRGDPSSGAYLAFWLGQDHRVLAGMQVNTWDTIDAVQDLIRAKAPVDPGRLADPRVELTEVGRVAGRP